VGTVGDGGAGGMPVGRARAVAVAQEGLAVLVGLAFMAGRDPPTAAVFGLATTFPPPPATLLPALAVEAVPVPVPDALLATARVCAAVNEVPAAARREQRQETKRHHHTETHAG
jgi:hypothetical protein